MRPRPIQREELETCRMSGFAYLAQLSVPAEKEQAFNEAYDAYLQQLLQIPGVNKADRYKLEWTDGEKAPEYLVIYQLDGTDVPKSDAWRQASIESGWAANIRPFLTTRRHAMFRKL
jgi:hypothetical protein